MGDKIKVVTENEMPWMVAKGWMITEDKSQTEDGNYRMEKAPPGSWQLQNLKNEARGILADAEFTD